MVTLSFEEIIARYCPRKSFLCPLGWAVDGDPVATTCSVGGSVPSDGSFYARSVGLWMVTDEARVYRTLDWVSMPARLGCGW
jgi:hypothetical protein